MTVQTKFLRRDPADVVPWAETCGAIRCLIEESDGAAGEVHYVEIHDAKLRRVTATIGTHTPGHGGEICFGAGSIWTTMIKTPLTRIDAATRQIVRQWTGDGGDSVRCGDGSIWLTDLRRGLLWRIPLSATR